MAIRCETDFLAFACLRTLVPPFSAGFADRLSLRKSFGSVSALLPSDAPAVGMLWQAGGGFANPFAMLSKFDGAKINIFFDSPMRCVNYNEICEINLQLITIRAILDQGVPKE